MSSKQFEPTGWHYLLELYECSPARIDELDFVLNCLHQAAGLAKATVIDSIHHQFRPTGITAVALLKESHLSIHCWPEAGYAAVDLFSCGKDGEPQKACEFLIEEFGCSRHQLQVIKRGLAHDADA